MEHQFEWKKRKAIKENNLDNNYEVKCSGVRVKSNMIGSFQRLMGRYPSIRILSDPISGKYFFLFSYGGNADEINKFHSVAGSLSCFYDSDENEKEENKNRRPLWKRLFSKIAR